MISRLINSSINSGIGHENVEFSHYAHKNSRRVFPNETSTVVG